MPDNIISHLLKASLLGIKATLALLGIKAMPDNIISHLLKASLLGIKTNLLCLKYTLLGLKTT